MKNPLSDPLKFASFVAHQLKGPVSSVSTILQTLLGEFAGPVTPKQKELLQKAIERCDEAMLAAQRLLAIAKSTGEPSAFRGEVELAAIVRKIAIASSQQSYPHNIVLVTKINIEPAWAIGTEAAMTEVLEALLSNAVKYTPDNGRIEMLLLYDKSLDVYQIRIADSGIGIPEENRQKVFQPFYRTPGAHASSRPGTGLGLAFVKAMVEAAGGNVHVEKSHLDGAELIVNLRAVPKTTAEEISGDKKMKKPMKVVIIGGVAAGPKVAAKINRLDPDADVTIVERGKLLSYAGCGLPYYIGGTVKDQSELMSSPAGVVRDPIFFQQVKNVHVMNQTEAIEIDRSKKQVRVRHLLDGTESLLDYDKLVLATGSEPVVPNIEGIKLGNIFTLHGVSDAEGIKAALDRGKARDVAIIGGGLIGIEMTEALVKKGCRVTIIEKLPQIFRLLDVELAMLVENYLESHGVRVLTDTQVKRFQGTDNVESVLTNKGVFPADLVIVAIGNRPNVTLAKQAGIEIGTTGAIKINPKMQTSDTDIYAAGDCVENIDMITQKPCYVPLGSTANKQGRVAAVNICGGNDMFAPILGTVACKVFDYNVAVTGLTEFMAKQAGFDVISVLVPAPDREHFVPGAELIMMKLVVDKNTRRLLGAQAIGAGNTDKRIDVAATAITGKMTVEQIANLDLCYAPPYAPVIDNIITAANVARNKLDGLMNGIGPLELWQLMQERTDLVLLDVRTPAEYHQSRLADSTLIPLASLRARFGEIDRNKPIVAFCNYSLRAYEAAFILKKESFKDVRVLDGGLEMWPYEKLQ
ncbi:MAG: FAD-dependent oxidoreductase [Planctomycetes bacterium]|nr:FAD-dependent oxidoreductase [Planctomycetota bacterium]MBU1518901.1 FAD-dependent oxidoreductase [Planctomycetota bacterium]MBU2457141.1 FAD-dependent oxidoreductase [Planctomycetota bacterium]MBU2596104.1 FAD-dependent oxidoreductase [Planctomycetota bacterium]